MTNSDLVRLNQEQKEQGKPLFANTRNVTAGSVRQLDPRICAQRRLRFFCHSVGDTAGLDCRSHTEFLRRCRATACRSRRRWRVRVVRRRGGPLPAVDRAPAQLDFEIDGLVLKVDRFDQRQRLG